MFATFEVLDTTVVNVAAAHRRQPPPPWTKPPGAHSYLVANAINRR
jgi:hypothetical protein